MPPPEYDEGLRVSPEADDNHQTNPHPHDRADGSTLNGDRGQGGGGGESPEIAFLRKLASLGVPVWAATPGYEAEEGPDCPEFHRPLGWQQIEAEGSLERLFTQFCYPTDTFPRTSALCANMGGKVAVVDTDPRNGGDVKEVVDLLDELKVRVFAGVRTPSGGWHFYIAGHEELPSVHSTTKNNRLPGYPGVDIQSYGTNVFLPGTLRWKKGGRGYTIEFDNLDALINEGDPEGAERFADWVADQLASHVRSSARGKGHCEFQFDPAPQWDGTPPDERQQKYLDTVLTDEARKVSEATKGGRNDVLNVAALKCGHYIAGAGMNRSLVIEKLELAASDCGLANDDGIRSVHATLNSGLRAGIETPRAVPPAGEEPSQNSDGRVHLRDRLLSLSDLCALPPVEPLVENFLYRDTLAQLSGGPGAYKTFAAVAMSCSLAAGIPFCGFPGAQTGDSGVRRR